MEKVLVVLRLWSWPLAVSVAILIGFATRGSDLPAPAMWLCAMFAALTAISMLISVEARPALSERPEVWRAALAFGLFSAAVGLPMLVKAIAPFVGLGFRLFDPSAALTEGLKLGGVICAFVLGLRLSSSDDRARRFLDALLYAGGLWAAASLFMFILDPAGIYGEVKFGAGRLTGAFSSPNSAGTLFGALSVMALGRVISRFSTRRETLILERIDPLMTAVLAISVAALMLTISRGAFFATLISGVGLCLFLIRGKVSLPIMIGTGVAGLLAVAILFATPMAGILARLDTLNDDATVRATIFESHFKFAVQQPFFGVGLGGFNAVNAHIVEADNYSALAVIRAMHNVYLQWFEETGAVGLLALGLLNLSILVPMFRAAGRRSQMGGRIWAILGGYAVFLLHGLTDYGFQEPALALFVATMLGCGFGISGNKTPDPKRPQRVGDAD